jgi:MoxR-like ATPase
MRSVDTAAAREADSAPLDRVLERITSVVLGKPRAVRLALACMLARGHLLIEDIPGVGKTTLAHTLAITLGLSFNRIQFTSDLLPADVLGGAVLEPSGHGFRFLPGPVFAQLVLCDEVNRASPKTQSALLEAMEERQVTHDGVSHPLPAPFFVVATQNPERQLGTFALPESQLDRFMMRLHLGYPDRDAERALLAGEDRRSLLEGMHAVLQGEQLIALHATVDRVHASAALVDYLQQILAHSRSGAGLAQGLSPRAGLALLQASRAWATLDGRAHVLPEDVQAVFPAVAAHRLREHDGSAIEAARIAQILHEVAVP